MTKFDADYFKGKTSPINYDSISYKMTSWLRFKTLVGLMRELNQPKGVLIDIGCAFGDLVSRLSREGYETLGCDVSRWAAVRAKKLHPEICVVRADANSLPFIDKAFSIVTMLETLEHCTQLSKVLEETHRVAASRGLVIFSVPTTDLNDTRADASHVWHLSLEDWLGCFQKRFHLVKVRYFLKHLRFLNKKISNTFIALEA